MYKSYSQIWYNDNLSVDFEFRMTVYIKPEDWRPLISVSINKWDTYSGELKKYMLVNEYFKKENIIIPTYEELDGNEIEGKIISFFSWFKYNIDEKMINILKGTDWIDLIVDWREKLDNLREEKIKK